MFETVLFPGDPYGTTVKDEDSNPFEGLSIFITFFLVVIIAIVAIAVIMGLSRPSKTVDFENS